MLLSKKKTKSNFVDIHASTLTRDAPGQRADETETPPDQRQPGGLSVSSERCLGQK